MKIDIKELGVLAEYVIRPILEDSNELIERLEKQKIGIKEVLRHAVFMYVFHSIVNLITCLCVTGAICYTVLNCLNTMR